MPRAAGGIVGRLFVATACMTPASCVDDQQAPDTTATGVDTAEPESRWPLPRTCVAPEGLGRPSTIEQVVELVNALPKPTTLPCVVESLERPLSLYASTSVAGAQPASGPQNPRIFLFFGDLTMSVVAEGEARGTLELSYALAQEDRQSIKAELVFPLDEVVPQSAPYEQVDVGEGTICGICHGNEARVESIDFAEAYSSDIYQDDPEYSLPLSFIRQVALDCDPEDSAMRCEMLDAVFGHGDVEPGDLRRNSIICRPP